MDKVLTTVRPIPEPLTTTIPMGVLPTLPTKRPKDRSKKILPEAPCNPGDPLRPDPFKCLVYYKCEQNSKGKYVLVTKACTPLYFNPQTLTCDSAQNVFAINPKCKEETYAEVRETTTVPPKKPTKPYLKACVLDPHRPHSEHPYSCFKFLHCAPDTEGNYYYVEKTCNPSTVYNPITMTCDHPASVSIIKPQCEIEPEKPEPDWEEIETIEKTKKNVTKIVEIEEVETFEICQDGFVWNSCAFPCGRACKYYKYILRKEGHCLDDSADCIAGCVPADVPKECNYPKVWRDAKTCVNIDDCMCVDENSQPVRVSNFLQSLI
jgi:hypothetical protein